MFNLRLILLFLLLQQTSIRSQVMRSTAACCNLSGYGRFADAFAVHANPAVAASFKNFTAGLYAERKFFLQGLDHYFLSAALPLKHGVVALSARHFNAAAWLQTEVGFTYAKRLGEIDIGARFNYFMLSINGYGKASALLVDVGSTWKISEQLYTSFALHHPAGGKLGKAGEKIAYACNGGFGFIASKQLLVFTEVLKEENKPVNIFAGIQYRPVPSVSMKAGIATASAQPFMLVSFRWKEYHVLIGFAYHTPLGGTAGFGVMFTDQQEGDEL